MFHRSRLTRSKLGSSLFVIFFVFIFISLVWFLQRGNASVCPSFDPLFLRPSTRRSRSPDDPFDQPHDVDTETRRDDLSLWCLPLGSRLDSEEYLPLSAHLFVPSVNVSSIRRLPYRYGRWSSSSLLPRRLTRCEHFLSMNLLMVIERICRENQIDLLMSDGTLLGSWRHHDLIPWDDDVDVMIPLKKKDPFVRALKQLNGMFVGHQILRRSNGKREYYKIFFANTPPAGGYSWNFPFVDVFLYVTNKTHLWQMADEGTAVRLDFVFPLVMRPLGELWLPAPRHPEKIFPFDPFDRCLGHFWDHRNETSIKQIRVPCDQLRDIYPFVHRSNLSNRTEILRLNQSIIHSITFV